MNEKNIKVENIENASNLFGNMDENVKVLEKIFDVKIFIKDTEIKLRGNGNLEKASETVAKLLMLAEKGEPITEQNIRYIANLSANDSVDELDKLYSNYVCITFKGKPIRAKTLGQKEYVEAIKSNIVTFGVGPAGTGKTYLAVAMAVNAYKNKEADKIILTRPAVEAGEKLGFLPGDLQDKVDPYLRPLYDALFEMLGAETFNSMMEKGSIEVAPLAYMRGRTLDNSFIILDEAQNTTKEQMKMFLTRIGFNSKTIVNGDITQIDLPEGKTSGLKDAISILKDIDGISIQMLTFKDVVRHPLVQKIIIAYEKRSSPKRTDLKKGKTT